jgi:hypothetical protein
VYPKYIALEFLIATKLDFIPFNFEIFIEDLVIFFIIFLSKIQGCFDIFKFDLINPLKEHYFNQIFF